jgi:predicted O-methyltransferase YrrM
MVTDRIVAQRSWYVRDDGLNHNRLVAERLSNEQFVELCYRTVLGRAPDEQGQHAFVKLLRGETRTREEVLLSFLDSSEFRARIAPLGLEPFPPGQFYSAVPSHEDRERALRAPERPIEGIEFHDREQMRLLNELVAFYRDCPFTDSKSPSLRYYYENPSYSYTDAIMLYCLIRHLRPHRIVEVGSGFSSCVMMDTNDLFFSGRIELTFVEPYPQLLKSVMRREDSRHRMLSKPLQDVDLDLFRSLEANDIVFIDSSHVSKTGSDVNTVFFDVLPMLRPGVFIHFHDIFWQFEYPAAWIREGRAWNEAYVLRAFLEFNQSFSVALFSSYLHHQHPAWFQKHMPLCLKNPGGSLWIHRVA